MDVIGLSFRSFPSYWFIMAEYFKRRAESGVQGRQTDRFEDTVGSRVHVGSSVRVGSVDSMGRPKL